MFLGFVLMKSHRLHTSSFPGQTAFSCHLIALASPSITVANERCKSRHPSPIQAGKLSALHQEFNVSSVFLTSRLPHAEDVPVAWLFLSWKIWILSSVFSTLIKMFCFGFCSFKGEDHVDWFVVSHICLSVYFVCGHVFTTALIWQSEDNLQEASVSFYHASTRYQPQVARFGSTCTYPPSYPTLPVLTNSFLTSSNTCSPMTCSPNWVTGLKASRWRIVAYKWYPQKLDIPMEH